MKKKNLTLESKNLPLVTVIMNCHNGQKFLKEAVQSILNQTYTKFELIFFNNFSSDQSENIVKSFNDERIKYYNSEKFLKQEMRPLKGLAESLYQFWIQMIFGKITKLKNNLIFFKKTKMQKYFIPIIIF